MDDSKTALGLGGMSRTVTNLKNDLLGLANVIENTLLPKIQKMSTLLNGSAQAFTGLVDAKGKPISSSSTKVSQGANDVPGGTADGDGGGPPQPGNNVVADNPARRTALGIGVAAGTAAFSALPNVATSVEQDFLTQRSAFYGFGGGGSLQMQTARVNSLQKQLAKQGTALNSMDTTNALIMAQSTGLGGVSNLNQVMQGAAQASNITPGLGLTQATAAIGGTMNAPTTVNLARTIGINIRQADGSMLPFPQMVDKLWSFISQNSGGRGMDKKSLQYSMQPGYGIYNMLYGLFNGDPVMIKMVSDGLLAKATFSGAPLGSISKDQMVQAGIQSATIRNIGSQTAAQTGLLVSTAAATAGGYAGAADIGTGMNNLAASMSDLTAALGGGKGFLSGTLGLGNGTIGSIAKLGVGMAAKSAFKDILPKALLDVLPLLGLGLLADGGPADSNKPYIVGEVGPELFIPKTDGVVISNKDLNSMHRDTGGGVKAFESSFFSDIKAPNTAANRAMLEQWMRYESGNNPMQWNNPMNSELRMAGSVSANKAGVQKYKTIAQGAQADANTLLNTKGESYDKIIAAFRAGTDQSKIWSSIVQSGWVTGKVDPTRTKYAAGSGTGASGAAGTSSMSSTATTAGTTSVATDPTAASRFAAATAAAFGGSAAGPSSTNYNYNYGGITIQINGAQSPAKTGAAVADAVKNIGKK